MAINPLTTRQAAKILKISIREVRFLIERGRLPAQKLGRDWTIRAVDLEKIKDHRPGRPRRKA
jgi:excisionase family DNA binding protein